MTRATSPRIGISPLTANVCWSSTHIFGDGWIRRPCRFHEQWRRDRAPEPISQSVPHHLPDVLAYVPDLNKWPDRWMIDQPDRAMGKAIVTVLMLRHPLDPDDQIPFDSTCRKLYKFRLGERNNSRYAKNQDKCNNTNNFHVYTAPFHS